MLLIKELKEEEINLVPKRYEHLFLWMMLRQKKGVKANIDGMTSSINGVLLKHFKDGKSDEIKEAAFNAYVFFFGKKPLDKSHRHVHKCEAYKKELEQFGVFIK